LKFLLGRNNPFTKTLLELRPAAGASPFVIKRISLPPLTLKFSGKDELVIEAAAGIANFLGWEDLMPRQKYFTMYFPAPHGLLP
jgi:hypothetical protein